MIAQRVTCTASAEADGLSVTPSPFWKLGGECDRRREFLWPVDGQVTAACA